MRFRLLCNIKVVNFWKPRPTKPSGQHLLVIKAVLVVSALLLFYVVLTNRHLQSLFQRKKEDELFCHAVESRETLVDISDYEPREDRRNIFFLETSCRSYREGKIFVAARQACAVESAARLNPDMDVFLLFASPGIIKDENTQSDRILRALNDYPNVNLLHFDVNKYIEKSPVERLWKSGAVRGSSYPLAHTSDILRLLTLWKFGGIYLDLDVIVIKSLKGFPDNFAGAENENLMANGVMGFNKTGKGRQYLNECMRDISDNFDGSAWAFNGPQLISRNIFKHCDKFTPEMLIRFGACDQFRIFPPSAFYMIPWKQWEWFFDPDMADVLERYLEQTSYMIHTWNKFSFAKTVSKTDTDALYLRFAQRYCPRVVAQLDDVF